MATAKPFLFFAEIRRLPAGESSRGSFKYLPPATRAELVLGSALIALSLLGVWWAFQCRSAALALERDSVIVEGKVLRLWVTRGKSHTHHVAYDYPAAPQAGAPGLQGEDELAEKLFNRLEEGGPIAVTVCRTDPANHRVSGGRPRAFSEAWSFPGALGVLSALALAGAINLWWWWACRRWRRGEHLWVLDVNGGNSTIP